MIDGFRNLNRKTKQLIKIGSSFRWILYKSNLTLNAKIHNIRPGYSANVGYPGRILFEGIWRDLYTFKIINKEKRDESSGQFKRQGV